MSALPTIRLFWIAWLVFLCPLALLADPKVPSGKALKPARKVYEWEGVETYLVLRQLGQEAKVAVIVDHSVTGTSSLRLEETTPLDAIRVITKAKQLTTFKISRKVWVIYDSATIGAPVGVKSKAMPEDGAAK